MVIRKVTYGCVDQLFDTEKDCYVEQAFYAGDQVDYKDVDSEGNLSPDILFSSNGIESYLAFDMVQPEGCCIR